MYYSEDSKPHKFARYLTLNANLGAISSGMFFVILTAFLEEMFTALQVPDEDIGIYFAVLNYALPLAAILGGFAANYFGTRFGRRKAMIIADYLAVIGAVLTIQPLFPVVLVGRFICGLCIGINFMIIPLYVREISPPELSGRLGSEFRIFFSLGLLIPFLIELPIVSAEDDNHFWKIALLVPCGFSVARVLIFSRWITMDSPQYYLENNEEENAIAILEKIFEGDRIEKVFNRSKKYEINGFSDIFGEKYQKQALLVILLIFMGEFMGANTLNFYTMTMFKYDQENPYNYTLLNIGFVSFRLIGSVIGRCFIDRLGRRKMIIFGVIATSMFAFLISFCGLQDFDIAKTIFLYIYVGIQGFSLLLVLPIYASELLPSFGVSFQVAIQMFSIILVTLVFQLLSPYIAFFAFGLVGLLMIFPISKRIVETKGKTLNEIYSLFHKEEQLDYSSPFDEEETMNNFEKLHVF